MNEPLALDSVRWERRGLTVSDFELLADGGAFVACGKTELIDGEVYVMNAQWARHAWIKGQLFVELAVRLSAMGSDLRAFSEASVRIADDSMPEPDITLARWRGERAIPGDTVALLAEIADSTLSYDLGRKRELYAAADIPEYWVVDVNAARVIVHTQPTENAYAQQREIGFGEPLAAMTIPGLVVETTRLLD